MVKIGLEAKKRNAFLLKSSREPLSGH